MPLDAIRIYIIIIYNTTKHLQGGHDHGDDKAIPIWSKFLGQIGAGK